MADHMENSEAAEARQHTTLEAIRSVIGGCREDVGFDKCWKPAEYVLWGKLIPAEGLGPRCEEHAAKHVGYYGVARNSGWAVVHLGELAERIDEAHRALRGA